MQANVIEQHQNYIDRLNDKQKQAVITTEGPLLVLAGAGTGKTSVLTSRIANIIHSGLAYPGQILSVTFTNKAAAEMRERVESLIGQSLGGMMVGTFHSICAKILRQHGSVLGFDSNFTIIDPDDQLRLLKKLLAENGIDEKRNPATLLRALINTLKDKAINPGDDKIGEMDFANGKLAGLYDAYQTRLKTINSMDFGDLILQNINLFQRHPDVLAQFHQRFKYLLVDEYQDTNVAQYLWLRLLAQGTGNICCVGDDDQSIYGWRGAEVGNILRFEKEYPNAEIIRLERNYRSTAHILQAASGLIAKNEKRLGKTLFTGDDNIGNKIKLKFLWNGEEEAKFIADEIETIKQPNIRQSIPYNQIAVLVRAGFMTRAFEERFVALNIPYKVVGSLKFYERAEIRDAIAYIRVLTQPDNDLALERIINLPKRGIGKASIDGLYNYSRQNNITLYKACDIRSANGEITGKAGGAIRKLLDQFTYWRGLQSAKPHAEVVEQMLEESGYIDMWRDIVKKERSLEAEGRIENLKELIKALEEFEGLDEFLEHISLVMDSDNNSTNDQVNIMTLHAAKGLEFEQVFLPGWEDGLFPSQKTIDEKGKKGLEEERRLAYVGITRAKRNLLITHAGNRKIYNQWQNSTPSRFIDEIPKDNIEQLPNDITFKGSSNFGGGFNSGANTGFDKDKYSFSCFGKSKFTDSNANANPAPKDPNKINIGDRVFHQKFGYGFVNGADGKNLNINFKHAGHKNIMADYVEKV